MTNNEGWAWPLGDLEQGNDNSPDNCKVCQKKLALEKQRDRKE